MDAYQLKRGNQLVQLIATTEKGLDGMKQLLAKAALEIKDHHQPNANYDGMYNLHIRQWSDGSGSKADLERYEGNAEVVLAIIEVLEKQLKEFKEEMKAL